jgi:hypothetical protein
MLQPLLIMVCILLPVEIRAIFPQTVTKFNHQFWNILHTPSGTKYIWLDKKLEKFDENSFDHRLINRRYGHITVFDLKQLLSTQYQNSKFLNHLYDGIEHYKQRKLDRDNGILMEYDDGDVVQGLRNTHMKYAHHFSWQLFIDGVSPWKHGKETLVPIYLANTTIR